MKNNNDDFWADEIDDDVPSWLQAWDNDSVFGHQASFLDDVDERQDIFGGYAKFTDKSQRYLGSRDDSGRRSTNQYNADSHSILMPTNEQLDFSNTKETSYSLGRVADQTNGVDLRHEILRRITSSYEKFVAFSLTMRTLPRYTDSLRLSKVAQKDNFDETIMKITQEKFSKLISQKDKDHYKIGNKLPSLLETVGLPNTVIPSRRQYFSSYNDKIALPFELVITANASRYNIHKEWYGLRNYRDNDWNRGLDISLLTIYNASHRVLIDLLGDSKSNVDKDFLEVLDNVEVPFMLDSYSIETLDKDNTNSMHSIRECRVSSSFDERCTPDEHIILQKEINMNTHITNGLDSIRDRYEDYHWFNNLENLDNLPTDEEYILSQVEQDSYLAKSSNFFNLDRDNLKELYNLLIKHYENNYSDLFKSQLESSEHPTEHLKSTIQMSVDWQNIWQDYLKKHFDNNDIESVYGDTFEQLVSNISMDSRKGSAMSPTMSKKVNRNTDELLEKSVETVEQDRNDEFMSVGASDIESNASRQRNGFQSHTYRKNPKVFDHDVPMLVIPDKDLVPSYTSPKINAILDHHNSLIGHSNKSYRGEITNKVWKINFGDLKVFKKKPKTQAKIRVVIDVSGSMGNIDDNSSEVSMAFKINNGISKAFNDVETYICAVTDKKTGKESIGKIKKGMMFKNEYNADWNTVGTTPLCLGLQHIKNSLSGDFENSVCILITDGYPNGHVTLDSGDYCNCLAHSKDLCNELYTAGMRFGSINIGYSSRLAPSDCTIELDEYKDLDEQTEEISNLFNWLLTKK